MVGPRGDASLIFSSGLGLPSLVAAAVGARRGREGPGRSDSPLVPSFADEPPASPRPSLPAALPAARCPSRFLSCQWPWRALSFLCDLLTVVEAARRTGGIRPRFTASFALRRAQRALSFRTVAWHRLLTALQCSRQALTLSSPLYRYR